MFFNTKSNNRNPLFSDYRELSSSLTDFVKGIHELYKKNSKEDETRIKLSKISILVSNCKTYNCLSTADEISKYLTSNLEIVRLFAALGLYKITQIIIEAASKESNPSIKEKLTNRLEEFTSTLNKKGYLNEAGGFNKSLNQLEYDFNISTGVVNMDNNLRAFDNLFNFKENPSQANHQNKTLSTLFKVNKLFSTPTDLGSCLKAIQELFKFLPCSDENMNKLIGEQICKLVKVAVEILKQETSTSKIQRFGKALFEVCASLKALDESGMVPLSAGSKNSLSEAMAIIKEKLCLSHKRDSFVSLKDSENQRTPWDKNIKHSVENLYGTKTGQFPIQA